MGNHPRINHLTTNPERRSGWLIAVLPWRCSGVIGWRCVLSARIQTVAPTNPGTLQVGDCLIFGAALFLGFPAPPPPPRPTPNKKKKSKVSILTGTPENKKHCRESPKITHPYVTTFGARLIDDASFEPCGQRGVGSGSRYTPLA